MKEGEFVLESMNLHHDSGKNMEVTSRNILDIVLSNENKDGKISLKHYFFNSNNIEQFIKDLELLVSKIRNITYNNY